MLSHPVFILELRIPSHRGFNVVQLLRSCWCFIALTSIPGRPEPLRQTPLSQGCEECLLKLCELALIRQCSNDDKEPGWESLVLAALPLCQRLCDHAHQNFWFSVWIPAVVQKVCPLADPPPHLMSKTRITIARSWLAAVVWLVYYLTGLCFTRA